MDPTEQEVVDAINSESIADEDLVSRDGWRYVCQVRGGNFNQIDEEAWQSLVRVVAISYIAAIRGAFEAH